MVSGRWVSWSVVGGSVVGGFDKTHSNQLNVLILVIVFVITNIIKLGY